MSWGCFIEKGGDPKRLVLSLGSRDIGHVGILMLFHGETIRDGHLADPLRSTRGRVKQGRFVILCFPLFCNA